MTLKFNSKIIRIGLLILLAVMLILLNGCTTVRRSQTRLFKVERDHPELLAKYCAEEFPIIEKDTSYNEIKPGQGYIDGGSVDCIAELSKLGFIITYGADSSPPVAATKALSVDSAKLRVRNYPKNYISTPCPPIARPDTVVKYRDRVLENTAALKVEKNAHDETKKSADKFKGLAKSYLIGLFIAGAIIILLAIPLYLLIKRQYKPASP